MGGEQADARETPGETAQIARHHPAAPQGEEPVVAATATIGGQRFPLRVGRVADGWAVTFGDLADEGRYATFEAALRAAHERIARDATELARSLRDGGY